MKAQDNAKRGRAVAARLESYLSGSTAQSHCNNNGIHVIVDYDGWLVPARQMRQQAVEMIAMIFGLSLLLKIGFYWPYSRRQRARKTEARWRCQGDHNRYAPPIPEARMLISLPALEPKATAPAPERKIEVSAKSAKQKDKKKRSKARKKARKNSKQSGE